TSTGYRPTQSIRSHPGRLQERCNLRVSPTAAIAVGPSALWLRSGGLRLELIKHRKRREFQSYANNNQFTAPQSLSAVYINKTILLLQENSREKDRGGYSTLQIGRG